MAPKTEISTPKVSIRRPSNQPKSSRQQFSACGACRIRRVRCDLKDLPDAKSCSNCQEHGFNCIDEFREVKSVKLLRRGRRIQQVEAVYGTDTSSEHDLRNASFASGSPSGPSNVSVIPRLDPQFFNSRFYPRFHIQRPIIEPEEFKARYVSFFNGDAEALGIPGQLIAMLLVVWAASYGVDEYGREELHDGVEGIRRRRQRTNDMVKELLHLIDIHGLPRKPSWDGVRVLLLVMPLTEEVAEPLERLTMYETAINQGESVDALVRARIYWYAFVHEGITTGLRGGRLHLADDDLKIFQTIQEDGHMPLARSQLTLTYSRRWALAPLRLAAACRQVHGALTGAKACSRPDVDEVKLHQAWESIETSWEEFESLRSLGLLGILTVEEADRFVDGWKIFIFECHNVIREFLKQKLVTATGGGDTGYLVDANSFQSTLRSLSRLHSIAESKCQDIARHVVSLVDRHIGTSFFEYDASLVRDGCFFAGYILAGESETEQYGTTCLQALSEMRWAFSKSEERMHTLRLIWEARSVGRRGQQLRTPPPFDPPRQLDSEYSLPAPVLPYAAISESRSWLIGNHPNSPSVASSPSDPSAFHIFDEKYLDSHRNRAMSSESSALSTGSPYTPSLPTAVPTSHPHPHYNGKTVYAIGADVYGEVPGQRAPLMPTNAPEPIEASTNVAYPRYAEQTTHPLGLPSEPPFPGMSFSSQPFVGSDGSSYTAPTNDPRPPAEDDHSYHGPPYFYS